MQLDQLKFRCRLCPHECNLAKGEIGKCLLRKGSDVLPYSECETFDISTIAIEPIEKKPLLYFKTGSKTLSLGSYGCSLSCNFCQNWKVSQRKPDKIKRLSSLDIINLAKEKKLKIVCFTYNEPTLFYPQIINLSRELNNESIDIVIKTNAYLNNYYWGHVCKNVNAMNIDFKGSECRHIDSLGIKEGTYNVIIENIETAINSDSHVEISIPVYEDFSKDDINPLKNILSSYVDKNIPLHLLRVFPVYKLEGRPTEKDKLERVREELLKFSNKIHIHNIYGK